MTTKWEDSRNGHDATVVVGTHLGKHRQSKKAAVLEQELLAGLEHINLIFIPMSCSFINTCNQKHTLTDPIFSPAPGTILFIPLKVVSGHST